MSVFVNFHEICGDSSLNNLDEVFTSFCRSPLHSAVISGNINLATKIISKKPDLALKKDLNGFTPLHLASARTNLQMVRLLLNARPGACEVKDKDGRTPLHLAAMKDRVEIMKVLMKERPDAIHLKNEKNGETILHFCVKNNNDFTTLKVLVGKLALARKSDRDTAISIDSKDNDGNTVLHLAAEMKKIKIVNYLLQSDNVRVDIDAINNKGLKALDMLPQSVRNDLEIGFYNHVGHKKELTGETLPENKDDKHVNKKSSKKPDNAERVNALLVVSTLIAAVAFQAALNPPGGVWQDDSRLDSDTEPIKFSYYVLRMYGSGWSENLKSYRKNPSAKKAKRFIINLVGNTTQRDTRNGLVLQDFAEATISAYNSSTDAGGVFFPYLIRYAGTPIMAYRKPLRYAFYMVANTIAFSLSLTIVFAVICGYVRDKTVAQNRMLVTLMCFSIGCISISYLIVLETLEPDFFIDGLANLSVGTYVGICCFFGIGLLLWRLISRMVKLHKQHLTVFNYFKGLFSMNASDAGKVGLLIIGLCALFSVYKGNNFLWGKNRLVKF